MKATNSLSSVSQSRTAPASDRSKLFRKTTNRSTPCLFEQLETRQLMSGTIAAVSFYTASGPHSAEYQIGPDHAVYESNGTSALIPMGGVVTQISAGLDASANPEVFGIAPDHTTWVNHGSGWSSLGGYVKQISASVNGTVYGIGGDNAVWVNTGGGWSSLGGYVTQISAGVDPNGKPEIYGVSPNNGAWVNDGNGWVNLGGYVKQIAGAVNGTVFGIGGDNGVWVNHGNGWSSLGGAVKSISAGMFINGAPEVYAIGTNNGVFINHGYGWINLGGSVTQISAPAFSAGLANCVVYMQGTDNQGYVYGATGITALPRIFTEPACDNQIVGWKNVSSNPLFAPGGPSASDVAQNQVGDCWFLSTLSEVALRDPARIQNSISERTDGTYDVTFHTSPTQTVTEHVDALLPVTKYGTLEYAQLGQNNCTWVAIMEKAFTYFRRASTAPAYASISGGSGYEGLVDLGGTPGEVLQNITNTSQLFSNVTLGLILGTSMEFGTNEVAGPLVGDHEYAVVSIRVQNGVDQVELRNPWGFNYGFTPNANGFAATNNGYVWVNASSILPQLDEFVSASM